jgi:hypothetical protein
MPVNINPNLLVRRPQITVTRPLVTRNISLGTNFSDLSLLKRIQFIPPNPNEINLMDYAPTATWTSGEVLPNGTDDKTQTLPWMGSDADEKGFVIGSSALMEDNATYYALRMHPMWVNYGMVQGIIPLNIKGNGTFKAKVGFLNGASNSDGVTFIVNVYSKVNNAQVCTTVATKNKRYSGALIDITADLTQYANQDIQLELRVEAGASSGQDWAAWVNPVIDIQPVATPNQTYELITKRFNTSELVALGISNVYQKTAVPNTYLIVPVAYSISLKDGIPFAFLEKVIILEDTSTEQSSASLTLGLTPRISGYQIIKFKTLLKQTLSLTTEVSLEYPAGSDMELVPESTFSLFGNIVLTYIGQTDDTIESHFLLSFTKVELNNMAGFLKLLSNSFALPVSQYVNSDGDESSVLDISLLSNNITGQAISTSPQLASITITNNTDSAISIKKLIIEDNTQEYDLTSLNLSLAKRGDSYDLTFVDILSTLSSDSNILASLLNTNVQKLSAAFVASYSNIHQNKFAIDYDVQFDDRKILTVDYTQSDSNQMCVTVTCPAPNSLTLSDSKDFFDAFSVDNILVTLGSDDNKIIVPKQIPMEKDAPRYQFAFVLMNGADNANRNITYQTTVKFTNGQPDLTLSPQTLNMSLENIIALDNQTLGLK